MILVHIAVQVMQICLKKMASRLNQQSRIFWTTTELRMRLQPKQGELEAFQHVLTYSTQTLPQTSCMYNRLATASPIYCIKIAGLVWGYPG